MLYPRQLGEEIHISIGTAIPMEMLSAREEPIRPVEYLYVNIKTLFRNFHGSFEKMVPKRDILVKLFNEANKKTMSRQHSSKRQSSKKWNLKTLHLLRNLCQS